MRKGEKDGLEGGGCYKKKKKKKIYEDWLFLVGKKVKGTSSLVILCNLKRRQLLQFSFVHF